MESDPTCMTKVNENVIKKKHDVIIELDQITNALDRLVMATRPRINYVTL